jgi:osmotically-inducible protein OsmY
MATGFLHKVVSIGALVVALGALGALGGCAAVVVGGAAAAGTAVVASDRRAVEVQVEDEAIERRVERALAAHFPKDSTNITAVSYNLRVLLVGQVMTEAARVDAERIARETQGVRSVANELTLGTLAGAASFANDAAITGLVKSALSTTQGVPAGTIKVVTERNVVYLMGRVTEAEGEAAARAASRASGVQRVVKVFDYLTPEQLTSQPPAAPPKP